MVAKPLELISDSSSALRNSLGLLNSLSLLPLSLLPLSLLPLNNTRFDLIFGLFRVFSFLACRRHNFQEISNRIKLNRIIEVSSLTS